ncbi:hypothetical protein C2E20_3688 [Micractinium conductrix]|uniref:Uncharacterized protein n=1 Tax=Micractinium conductrix TaxID=554055 RepID=A0A2P6VG16_9CHLO|nr:hypothetical protein C2E20_3688 [Micractinium conductrix]|eukprot:PSC73033.1 hypothetical protein C2E20_3688 [Micractinium conductrix]
MLKCATKLIKDYPHCRAALVVQSPYNSSGSGKKWRRPFLYGFGDDPQQQELLASLAVHIASCEGRSVDWRLGWAAAAAGLTVEELAKFRELLQGLPREGAGEGKKAATTWLGGARLNEYEGAQPTTAEERSVDVEEEEEAAVAAAAAEEEEEHRASADDGAHAPLEAVETRTQAAQRTGPSTAALAAVATVPTV